jgi:hypothetical protein
MEWLKERVRLGIIAAFSVLAMLCCAQSQAEDQPEKESKSCAAAGQCLKEAAHKLIGRLFAYPKKFGLATWGQVGAPGSDPAYLPADSRFPARFNQPYHAGFGLPMGPGPGHWDMENVPFHDNSTLVGQLSQVEDLSLVTFWENRSAKLYLGISKDGIAGINIRQKRKRARLYGTSAPSNKSNHRQPRDPDQPLSAL